MIDNEDFEAQPTPSPHASPAFCRLRKGPRPQVTLSSVPEGEEHQSVSRKVFPEASPTTNIPESEAKTAEDISAASANDQEEEPRDEGRAATPLSNPEVVLEENVSDPPATRVEVENSEASTNTNTEANDVVMAEASVAPEATVAPEVNVVPEVHVNPEAIVQLEAHVNANAPVPPPRPHAIEVAFDRGQPVMVRWPILVPPPAPGPQFDDHVEHMPQVQKPKPRLPRFPGIATS